MEKGIFVEIVNLNILNVKGLHNEDEKTSVNIAFFSLDNVKIYLYLNLFPLEPFSLSGWFQQ